MIANMDMNIGRLLQLLDALHVTNNTLVFFTSDNGPENGAFTWKISEQMFAYYCHFTCARFSRGRVRRSVQREEKTTDGRRHQSACNRHVGRQAASWQYLRHLFLCPEIISDWISFLSINFVVCRQFHADDGPFPDVAGCELHCHAASSAHRRSLCPASSPVQGFLSTRGRTDNPVVHSLHRLSQVDRGLVSR